MTTDDEQELEWWRKVFSTRFQKENLPPPGTALYGHRFTLMVRFQEDDVPYGLWCKG